ncbi:MAG: FtsW/RodA/SpoVE family cell cycle protein [Chloroflexota bacterium]
MYSFCGQYLAGSSPVEGGPRISLDLGPVAFQPSELIKLLLVIYLAAYLSVVRPDFNRFTYRYLGVPMPLFNYLWPMLLVLGGVVAFLALMSDLGAALILIGIFPVMLFVAVRRTVFTSLVLIFGLLILLLYFGLVQFQDQTVGDLTSLIDEPETLAFVPDQVTHSLSRVLVRIENWRNPWVACGDNNGCPSYQTLQSLYSIAAGGLWGTGPGLGLLEYIPAVFTDLVYAAIAEEWGLLGASAILVIYWYLLKRGGRIAQRRPESFENLLAIGIVSIFALQLLVIIGGTLNIIPLTGITVPYLSYGGTSIWINFVMVGLLLRLSAGPGRIPATAETRGNIGRVMRLYGLGFLMLFLALAYWTLWKGPELHPAFPTYDQAFDNPVLRQRQAAWLTRVVRGQILATDGTIIAGHGQAGRLNYYPSLMHAVGLANPYGLGLNGLEHSYNDVLLGKGRYDLQTLWARQMEGEWVGNNLKLSIDLPWQQAAHEGLGAFDGAVVVLDAESGAVLAMVSHPLYDPATTDGGDSDQGAHLNRATMGLYPPGSTFKTMVGALAMEQGLVGPDTPFDFTADNWYWAGERLCHERLIGGGIISSCNSYLQQMTFSQGFAWSDNILFAQLAGDLGQEQLWAGADSFGFAQELPFDLPVATSQLAEDPAWLNDPAQLAMTGFGQSQVTATPLHMALVAATIANDGWMPQPYLVAETLRPDGTVLSHTKPQSLQWPLSRGTARSMAQVMVESVKDGWASSAAVPGLTVGGKTGTAEWTGSANGTALPHSWFIGFAEMPNDQTVAIAVIAEAAGEGSDWAAPIAGYVLNQMNYSLASR